MIKADTYIRSINLFRTHKPTFKEIFAHLYEPIMNVQLIKLNLTSVSTITALFNPKAVCLNYLDLSQAFNTADHGRSCKKLKYASDLK